MLTQTDTWLESRLLICVLTASPPSLSSTSFVPGTQTLGKEYYETKSYSTCKLFLYQLWEVLQCPWPSHAQPARAHSIMTTDSSCRRKCPPTGNSSEAHPLASGVISANFLGREKLTHLNEIKSREGQVKVL